MLTPEEAEEDGVPLLAPESAGPHGPEPEHIRLPTVREQADYMTGRLRQFHDEGLEFPVVAIPHAEVSDGQDSDEKEEARLLYGAMTRAMERLVVGEVV